MPEDDPKFQGLLENKDEEAVYPVISAELPGVTLEDDKNSTQVVIEEEEPDFADLVAQALENAGIDTEECIRAANNSPPAALPQDGPALVEADNEEIVYELTFDLPDAGLGVVEPNTSPAEPTLGDDQDDTMVAPVAAADDDPEQRYPTQLRRSVIGHQPYDMYAPGRTFLQLGTTRAHRSVIKASCLIKMTKAERLLAMTTSDATCGMIDNAVHKLYPELTTRSEDEIKVWGHLMTQYNSKPGLQKFGQGGADAAVKELTQLHVMDTWTAMEPTKLTREERMRALSSLLFLKEKQTGTIKVRACINGVPQHAYISKEDAALPTVSSESTFITASIAAKEKRMVRCYNVPSAFVNTDIDKDVLMVLKGELAEMMVQIVPQIHQKYITMDKKGRKILYVKLRKVLYGLMRASVLFYRKLRKEFKHY